MSNEQEKAEQDVIATTDSYGGPVSDEELADVYLPEGQDEVQGGSESSSTGTPTAQDTPPEPADAPDGSGTTPAAPTATVEPPD